MDVTPTRSRAWEPAFCLLLLCVVSMLVAVDGLRSHGTMRHAPSLPDTLVHWHDAGHDWLLVADDRANMLTIYDATDGRPLHQFGSAAVGDVATLVQRDGHLFVIDDDGARSEFKLPQLQRIASSNP